MIITEENLPLCAKCHKRVTGGGTYISQTWVCGECFGAWSDKQQKNKLKAIIEG